MVLSNNEIKDAILSERESEENILAGFMGCQCYKNHTSLQTYRHAIRIELYYDDFEIVNPIGSKTGIHKLGAFYFRIQNLHPHLNSGVNSIHVVSLSYTEDVKKYGFKKNIEAFPARFD